EYSCAKRRRRSCDVAARSDMGIILSVGRGAGNRTRCLHRMRVARMPFLHTAPNTIHAHDPRRQGRRLPGVVWMRLDRPGVWKRKGETLPHAQGRPAARLTVGSVYTIQGRLWVLGT